MTDLFQCKACGAVLAAEDEFCGECGTPLPPSAKVSVSPSARVSGAKVPMRRARPPARPAPSSEIGWRVAFLIFAVVGALACLAGVVSFLFTGFIPSEGYTAEENWGMATMCCLLPLAGSGAIFLVTGLGIWYSRLRKP